MTDEELTDRAARAQGWIDFPQDSIEGGSVWHTDEASAPFGRRIDKRCWQPLYDFDDATRLALTLRIAVDPRNFTVLCGRWDGKEFTNKTIEYYAEHDTEALAVCRAIVRCAAGDSSIEAEKE